MAITIGSMIAIPNSADNFQLLAWMVFAHNIFASLLDVSVDALAVDLLTGKERGRTNGLMFGSSYFGSLGGVLVSNLP